MKKHFSFIRISLRNEKANLFRVIEKAMQYLPGEKAMQYLRNEKDQAINPVQ